ncbi:hypothetical protein NE237_015597 [Protea cynaroides]|uniref:Uncharacterized protein n=1 Tax=Protea cynaroides TaxID=273540 RepID=A0A9Q0KEL8_9MAGN|nr:hypothetical protein NE237_015597 [Protea cynaroides]
MLYSPQIFKMVGITGRIQKIVGVVAAGFEKMIFMLAATFFMQKIDRRPLLLTSIGGMILSLLCLEFGLTITYTHPNEDL